MANAGRGIMHGSGTEAMNGESVLPKHSARSDCTVRARAVIQMQIAERLMTRRGMAQDVFESSSVRNRAWTLLISVFSFFHVFIIILFLV